MVNGISQNKIIGKIKEFFDFKYFPLFIFAITLLTHILALDLVGWILLVLFAVFTNLFCDDLRPILPLATLMPFVVSNQNTPGYAEEGWVGFYANNAVIVTLFIIGVLAVLSFIVRPILYKGTFKRVKDSKLILGFISLAVCYLLAGLFSEYLDFNNYILSLLMVACHSVFYFFIFISLNEREDNFEYLCKVMVLGGLLITLEIAYVYLTKYQVGTQLSGAWKSEIIIGSLPSNPAGGFIALTLPFFFYLAYKNKCGYLYYIMAIICLIGVFFTLSRGAFLISAPVFVLGSIFACVFAKNKKPLIITAILSVVMIGISLLVMYKLGAFERVFNFYIENSLNDHGRFDIWKEHFELFKDYPIFGSGFSANMIIKEKEWIFISLAHNTLVQVLTSAGIIGFILYAFHRCQTAKLFLTNINLEKTIICISVLVSIGMGLLDPTFFYPQFALVYSFTLCFAEKQKTGTKLKNLLNKGENL